MDARQKQCGNRTVSEQFFLRGVHHKPAVSQQKQFASGGLGKPLPATPHRLSRLGFSAPMDEFQH
jgi:hypothetical protein